MRMHKTTRRTIMRLSISMPEDLHKQVLVAAANPQLKTLKTVTVSDLIRDAIQEKLNMLSSGGDAKGNSIPDAPAPVLQSAIADGTQMKKRRARKITPELHARFVEMQDAGATARQIADAVKCSISTVSLMRKELKTSRREKLI